VSDIPADLHYTTKHEWLRRLPNGQVEIGISDYAQKALGDLVFVEVPEIGRRLRAGEACAVVESVKAASDVYSPISGTVVAGNDELASHPELVNLEPYTAGWLMRMEIDAPEPILLDADAYAKHLAVQVR